MPSLGTKLLELYTQLALSGYLGFVLGRILPPVVPVYLGKFLFWVGVPVGVVAFLRRTDLSGNIWMAPAIAWLAILLGAGLAWTWLQIQAKRQNSSKNSHRLAPRTDILLSQTDNPGGSPLHNPTRGSFILASMVGNTGYIGYPVILTLVGEKYFAWAVFYDLLGTTVGAYGLGVALAVRFGDGVSSPWLLAREMLLNPTLWSLGLGVVFRDFPLPMLAEISLQKVAWSAIALSLILIGMRLSHMHSWGSLRLASVSLGIKMLVVPLVLGTCLSLCGIGGAPQLVLVLQMAMPPAFATLVLAEAYNLDRDLTVTALAVGSIGLLVTLPLWLWLFGS